MNEQRVQRRGDDKPPHHWGPAKRMQKRPSEFGFEREWYQYSCRRCGCSGKRFAGNPHIVADQPGGCWS